MFLHGDLGAAGVTLSVDNAVFFARLGQRIIHYSKHPHRRGLLVRDRRAAAPSGASGLLVSSIDSFEDYQLDDAWTWEHQALVRARPSSGRPSSRSASATSANGCSQARDPATLCREVREMRERMRSELGSGGEGRFDLKQDPGGIADIEFIVQYVVLQMGRAAPRASRIHRHRSARRVPEAALMPAEETELLRRRTLVSRADHTLALQSNRRWSDDEQLRECARRCWRCGSANAGWELRADTAEPCYTLQVYER